MNNAPHSNHYWTIGETRRENVLIAKANIMTKFQKILIAGTILTVAGAGIYEARQISALQIQLDTFRTERKPLTNQIQQLRHDCMEASATLAFQEEQNSLLRGSNSGLLRLRSEVTHLREDGQELAELKAANDQLENDPALLSWLERVKQLKKHSAETSGTNSWELQFVSQHQWLAAARNELKSDEDYRRAMASLRNSGGIAFGKVCQLALRNYIRMNEGRFPNEMNQLKPYFDPPVDDALLQRYELRPAKDFDDVGPGDSVIVTKAPVDKDYDARGVFGANGYTFAYFDTSPEEVVKAAFPILAPAMEAYKRANYGLRPDGLSELTPYLSTDEERAALEKILDYRKNH